ncbi:uncharacterized protein K489DRAFT_315682, partial [Dissoconium aciculare CBS 342.82]|uniref:Uncharacterized protein n=1 Tax=Dissoconium aciculare CBS 342.82 TaxID=1314786 RepID=A0A6J3MAR7_9PEZI
YEETLVRPFHGPTSLQARGVRAKIEDEDHLISISRNLLIIQHTPDRRCRTWVASALHAIASRFKPVRTEIDMLARKHVARIDANGRYGFGTNVLAA